MAARSASSPRVNSTLPAPTMVIFGMREMIPFGLDSRKLNVKLPEMNDPLAALVTRHRAGEPVGSRRCARRIRWCWRRRCVRPPGWWGCRGGWGCGAAGAAGADASAGVGGLVLVEATSNQVNQHGGYTGMRPPDFRELVHGAARDAGVAPGGCCWAATASGPTRGGSARRRRRWRSPRSSCASTPRLGSPRSIWTARWRAAAIPRLGDALVSERAARLAGVAEQAAEGRPLAM